MRLYTVVLVDIRDDTGKTLHRGDYRDYSEYEAVKQARKEFAIKLGLDPEASDTRLTLKVVGCTVQL